MSHNVYNVDCLTCTSYITTSKAGERLCYKSNDPMSMECPCAVCLIKSMCEKGCTEYYNFWHTAIAETYKSKEGTHGR